MKGNSSLMRSCWITRRRLLLAGAAGALLPAARVGAQPTSTPKVRRIGVLLGSSRKRRNIELLLGPFDRTLRKLFTLDHQLILRKAGSLGAKDREAVARSVRRLLKPAF